MLLGLAAPAVIIVLLVIIIPLGGCLICHFLTMTVAYVGSLSEDGGV